MGRKLQRRAAGCRMRSLRTWLCISFPYLLAGVVFITYALDDLHRAESYANNQQPPLADHQVNLPTLDESELAAAGDSVDMLKLASKKISHDLNSAAAEGISLLRKLSEVRGEMDASTRRHIEELQGYINMTSKLQLEKFFMDKAASPISREMALKDVPGGRPLAVPALPKAEPGVSRLKPAAKARVEPAPSNPSGAVYTPRLLDLMVAKPGLPYPDQTWPADKLQAKYEAPNACPPKLHYMSDGSYPKTSLVSPPGAGNTWLRHLLEQATGIYTGAIYNDKALKKHFPGEGVRDNRVIAIKMHESGPMFHDSVDRAVILTRNPYKSIIAEQARASGGHTAPINEDKFRGAAWSNLAVRHMKMWVMVLRPWLTDFAGPLHIVSYERLQSDPRAELRTLLDFLQWQYSDTQLDCLLHNTEGHFHRKSKSLSFNPFSANHEKILDHYFRLVADWPHNRDNRTAWYDVHPIHW